jgi:ATP-dependent DNA helicase RecG
MPRALETLVKILKLEREKGFKNNAVEGGLASFSVTWVGQAHTQARTAEHHALVDELGDTMRFYDSLEDRDRRSSTVEHMLGRITRQIPPPVEQANRIAEWQARLQENPPSERVQETAGELNQQARSDDNRRVDSPRENQRSAHTQAQTSAKHEQRDKQSQSGGEARQNKPDNTAQKPRRDNPGQPPRTQRPPQSKANESQDGEERAGNAEYSSLDLMEFRSGGTSQPDIPLQITLARPPRSPRRQLSPEESSDLLRGLSASVEVVRGIGPSKVALLNKLGIATINDLLTFLPRRYDDYTKISLIRRLEADKEVTVIGTVSKTEVRISQGGRKDFYMVIDDGSASLGVTFFSQHYLIMSIRAGQQLVLHGTTKMFRDRIQIANPEWDILDVDDLKAVSIVPVYPLTEGLTGKSMRKLMKRAVEFWAEEVPDYVPEATLDRTELADLGWAVKNLHFPESFDHLHHARRRYVFDQLLLTQLAILDNRRTWQSAPSTPLHIGDDQLNDILTTLFPYELTNAQKRAISDIRGDIARDVPMNRLLQGDVGSGKTAIAIAAMAIAFLNGRQAAIMAPTGILAEQHFRNISRTMEAIPGERRPRVAVLTGSISAAERSAIYEEIANGAVDIVIGTHAIIQGGVEFRDLALTIIDEQHRFGVEQRGALRGKGTNPHLLVMTATPIPRTLALTIYADLDLSVMDEMPPGRTPVKTKMVEPIALEAIYNFIKKRLDEGQQAFVVFPLVEASENIDAESAVEAYQQLQKVFFRYKVGLLHGRMKPAEKDEVMAAFREQNFDVLVTTSVAEVGVDIPNASVIVIHSAHRFGLAQLHQFRGRVGRGGHESYCFLVCDSKDDLAQKRLRALEQTTNGFQLAEIDWKLRGPGDLMGTRQSGQAAFKLMEAMTPELVELAQHEARAIFEEDAALTLPQHHLLAQRVSILRNERSDLS